MTATEKLLVQIFERRDSIIEHVKQKTESYSQHLASKLLIDGITPPSWLWNPNSSTSEEKDSNELNKEELISKLLRPYQQPSHYPVFDNVVFRGDNEELSDGFFMENRTLSGKDHSIVPPLSSEDRTGCAISCAPEPDASVTSPEDQPDERGVNIYNAPDQSLSRIQRSKSRQKALQLRSSGTTVARSGVVNKNIQDASPSHIKFSLSATDRADQNDKSLKSAEPCVNGSQSCAERNENTDIRSKVKENNASTCRVTSSRTHVKVPDFVRDPLTVGCSSENYKENAPSHLSEVRRTPSVHISDSQKADDNYVNKWSKSAGPTTTLNCQNCGDTQVHDADCLNKGTTVFTDRITRSTNISSKCQSCVRDSLKAVNSSDDDPRIETVMMDYRDDLPPDTAYGLPLNPANDLIEEHDSRESISSDCQSHKSKVSVPSCSSNQQNAGLDGVSDIEICSHSVKSDGGILVSSGKSVQDVNDSIEVRGFFKPSDGLLETMSLIQSPDKELYEPVAYNEEDLEICSHSARADDGILASSAKSMQGVNDSNEVHGFVKPYDGFFQKATMSPTQSHDKELCENQAEESGPVIIGAVLNNSENETEVGQNHKTSEVFQKPDSILSKLVDMPDIQIHPTKLDMEDGLEASPKLHVDEGDQRGEENDKIRLMSSTPGSGNLRASLDTSQLMSSTPGSETLKASLDTCQLMSSTPGSETLKASLDTCQLMSSTPGNETLKASLDTCQSMSSTPGSETLKASLDTCQLMSSTPGSETLKASLDTTQLMSCDPSPGSENLRGSHAYTSAKEPRSESCDSLIENLGTLNHICGVLDKMEQLPAQQSQISPCLEGGVISQHRNSPFRDNTSVTYGTVGPHDENSSLGRRFRNASMESWPQLKRKKTEHNKTPSLTTSPSCRARKPQSTQRESASAYLKNMDIKIDSEVDTFHVDKHTDIEIPPEMALAEGVELPFLSQNGEVELCCPEKNEREGSPSFINNEQLGSALVSRLKKDSMDSQGSLIEEISNTNSSSSHFDASELGDGHHSQHLCNLEKDIDNVSSANPSITNTKLGGIQQASPSVHSPRTEDLELIDVDQSMPELEGKNEHEGSPSFINNEQLGSALVSRLKTDSMDSQGSLIEEISNTNSSSSHFDASELGDGHHSQHLCNLEKDIDNVSSANPSLTNTKLGGIQQTSPSVHSPRTEDLELIDVDQSMPELEGFIVDAGEGSGVLNFAEDEIDFDKLMLPSNSIERASMLAEICRSASLDKPSYHFSSAFEFQRNQNFYESVPNSHLDDLDLSSSLSLNSDVGEQFKFDRICVNDSNQSLVGTPFSVSPAYSSERCGWNLRSPYTSPVGKLWERLSSHTGSSEKRLSSNPELTCFPIEEDASISEGNRTVDENKDDDQEVDSSLAKHNDKRQPLKDLSNLGFKPSISASAHETTLMTDVGFGTKLSVTGAQDSVHPGAESQYRNKRETSDNQTSSIGATDGRKNQFSLHGTNGIKKAKESINNSISKSSLSIRTGLKRQGQKLSLKDSRRNNIISNVSSFIPLVQQKQAATICAGKRDVKVKALEAAEAAKRLEEKKENERKMKKEALKLERAKLEEKNLRQLELEKQKKEEERKKKDADIITKKRQREEEERKEKEKKRMRLEARHRQRGQEEKNRGGKAEKGNQWSKDEQMNSKKELLNDSKKQQNKEIVRGDDVALRKADTILTSTEVINYEECGSSGQSCEVGKAMHAVDKSPRNEDLIVHNSKGKSYEISPYQCSDDDEEEEDDELRPKKSIPSWASKSSVALFLPLEQEMDPDTIFPLGSFCSMKEVLLPRKLQQKQVTF